MSAPSQPERGIARARLYVYYRVPEAQLAATVAAVRKMQAALTLALAKSAAHTPANAAAHAHATMPNNAPANAQPSLRTRLQEAAPADIEMALLRRPDAAHGEVTLMEAYTEHRPDALSPGFEAALAQAAQTLPQPRHVERFELL